MWKKDQKSVGFLLEKDFVPWKGSNGGPRKENSFNMWKYPCIVLKSTLSELSLKKRNQLTMNPSGKNASQEESLEGPPTIVDLTTIIYDVGQGLLLSSPGSGHYGRKQEK